MKITLSKRVLAVILVIALALSAINTYLIFDLRRALEGVDAVVHLAGIVEPMTEHNPELAYSVNVGGTRTIVDVIRERGTSIPFVFISSVAVFGPAPDTTEDKKEGVAAFLDKRSPIFQGR